MEDIQCDLKDIKSLNVACFMCYKLVKETKKVF